MRRIWCMCHEATVVIILYDTKPLCMRYFMCAQNIDASWNQSIIVNILSLWCVAPPFSLVRNTLCHLSWSHLYKYVNHDKACNTSCHLYCWGYNTIIYTRSTPNLRPLKFCVVTLVWLVSTLYEVNGVRGIMRIFDMAHYMIHWHVKNIKICIKMVDSIHNRVVIYCHVKLCTHIIDGQQIKSWMSGRYVG